MGNQVSSVTPKVDSVTRYQPAARMESLDGLRGIAALVVVLAHGLLMQPFYWDLLFGPKSEEKNLLERILTDSPLKLIWGGGNAVILFFVLSGFVLTLPWISGRHLKYGKYLISRFFRIYIPYLASMILASGFAVVLGGEKIAGASDWVNNYGWANSLTTLTIPSVLLMLGNDYSTWLNNPTWSLVWEVRVSLLFPLLVIPIIRWRLAGVFLVAAILWITLIAGQELAGIFPYTTSILGRPHMTFYYAVFFLIGISFAIYHDVLTKLTWRFGKHAASLLMLTGLYGWYVKWPIQPELMKGLSAGLIIIASISNGIPRRMLLTAPVQWLGRVSYSLYLVHVPVFLIAEYLMASILPHSIIAPIAIIVALALSEIFYKMVEGPAHRLGRRLVKREVSSRCTDKLNLKPE